MSGFNLFEANVSSDDEAKRQQREAADKLAAATYDVRERFGQFLFGARDLEEYRDRLALTKNDIIKAIEPHVFPRTGVVRRVLKPIEAEFRGMRRQAAPEDEERSPYGLDPAQQAYMNSYGLFPSSDVTKTISGTPVAEGDGGFKRKDAPLIGPAGGAGNSASDDAASEGAAGGAGDPGGTGLDNSMWNPNAGNESVSFGPTSGPASGAASPGAAGGAGGGGAAATGNPIGPGEYTIQSGDTYSGIAQRAGWGDDYQGFAEATGYNPANNLDMIYAGDTMNIPEAPGSTTTESPSAAATTPTTDAGAAAPAAPDASGVAGTGLDAVAPAPALNSPQNTNMGLTPTARRQRRRADFEGEVDTDITYTPSDDELEPEGDFKGYLKSVDQGADKKVDRNFVARFAAWCRANRVRPTLAALDRYNPGDRAYFTIAAALQRKAYEDSGPTTRVKREPEKSDALRALEWQLSQVQGPRTGEDIGDGNLFGYDGENRHRVGRRRTAAPDYLQKADEALTNLLNQKAEEFQGQIAPLQQALMTVQQAEAEQQAANPLSVMPPAGTVNVLPGQDQQGGGEQIDPAMLAQMLGGGGGDPSMGGGGGDIDPAMLAQLMGGGGEQPPMDPSMMMQARRRRRQAGAKSYDIAGYTYDAQNFEPQDLIEYMIQRGDLSPAARDMDPEEVLNQHAGANAIDRFDEGSYDSGDFPKVIFQDQISPEYDSDWYSGYREGASRRQAGDSAKVKKLPECDIHKYEEGKSGVPAEYDGKTQYGPWANMCEDHFKSHGVGLGTGKGQRLVESRRRQGSVSLKNVKIKDKSRNLFSGEDSSGAEVVFRASDDDARQLRDVMFGDLGMNFSGVTVDDSDIVKSARRRVADMPVPRGTDPDFTPHFEGGDHGDIYYGDGDWMSDYGQEPDDNDRARWRELTKKRDEALDSYIRWQAREEKAMREGGRRQAKSAEELWNKWVSSPKTTLRGDESDYENFAKQFGVGERAINKLRQQHGGPTKTSARKEAWSGWGQSQPGMRRVAGWDFDHRLNGYITTAADHFSCDCGEGFPTPSGYRKCGSCGKAWNSYVIGTDGHGREASVEKVIVREIPVRKDVIVANNRQGGEYRKRKPVTILEGPAKEEAFGRYLKNLEDKLLRKGRDPDEVAAMLDDVQTPQDLLRYKNLTVTASDCSEDDDDDDNDEDVTIEHFSKRKKAEIFKVTEEGGTPKGEGKDPGTPRGKKSFPDDWPRRDKNQRWTR